MKLYYGLTNYHLLCSILHKYIYNMNEKAIFVASQGILQNRMDILKQLKIFDEVYYLEDKFIEKNYMDVLKDGSSKAQIENVMQKFTKEYEKILPFNLNNISDIYLNSDHGLFGIYILNKKCPYIYIEDGRGMYSKWQTLDKLLYIKNHGVCILCRYYNAYGRSNLVKKRYISFDSQTSGYNFENCYDFDINNLLDKLTNNKLNKILNLFNVKERYDNTYRSALILTQRFSTYKMLSENDCIRLYKLLSEIFAKNYKIYLKPHPADKCDYSTEFSNAIILDKEMPSELIRFSVKDKFDLGIATFSSSIFSLKPYINKIIDIDETIINFVANKEMLLKYLNSKKYL